MDFENVIGFEIHTELMTESKVFCGCSTVFGQPPNTQTCPVCLGMPGSLPVVNEHALDLSIRTALALNCQIARRTQFERKNYYYPDLPKNYQISQLRKNLGEDGHLDIEVPGGEVRRIGIDNIHLEEDAGKNMHPEHPRAHDSLVDLNRAGTPLLEIVTDPDLRSIEEARIFMETLKSLLEYIEVSDCNMHEGRLRFEANISLRPAGSDVLGTKVEIKNLNSMKTVIKCIEAEVERQGEILEDGGRVLQETRLWDEAAEVTRAMRSKEVAQDYRYFPDPDLLEVEIGGEWIERVRSELPELPRARHQRFKQQFSLSDYDARVLTASKPVADYFEAALQPDNQPKTVANWIGTEVLRFLNEDPDRGIQDYPVPAAHLGRLAALIDKGTISSKIAKTVYKAMMDGEGDPDRIVKQRGLLQISDTSQIEPIVQEVIAANPKIVEDVRGGKERALGALVGQVMKATRGKANPQVVNELLRHRIQG